MSLYIIYLGTLGTLGTRRNKWQPPAGFVEMLWFRVRGALLGTLGTHRGSGLSAAH